MPNAKIVVEKQASARPRQLRPRPKAPTTKKIYPLQKRSRIFVKDPKLYKSMNFFKLLCIFYY